MDYAELKTLFTGTLNRSDLTSTLTQFFFDQAQNRIMRDLRTPDMEKVTVLTTITDKTAVPNDYLEIYDIIVNPEGKRPFVLERMNSEDFYDRPLNGNPRAYLREGNWFYFRPHITDGTTVHFHYYADDTRLVNDTDENTLSNIAPDLLIYGAMAYATDYYMDERANRYEQKFQDMLSTIQLQAFQEQHSGGSQRIQPPSGVEY